MQNQSLVLNLATQHFTEDLPGSLHVPFCKGGTNASQQGQQAVLPASALRNGLRSLFWPADRDEQQKSSASTWDRGSSSPWEQPRKTYQKAISPFQSLLKLPFVFIYY